MDLDIPNQVGVMILPEVALFPSALLPLYIFEPRYRIMLAHALDSHRMFAVTAVDPASGEPCSIGGVGFVRACVANGDGTSNLVLQGAARVRFSSWLPGQSYPQARIGILSSRDSGESLVGILRQEIHDACARLAVKGGAGKQYFSAALELEKPSGFCDMVSAAIVNDAVLKQRLMEELDVVQRLKMLSEYLRGREEL